MSVRRIRLRLISCAVGAVVGMSTLNDDLLGLVFAHAGLDAKGLVAVGRVNRQWRRVVHANAQVLVLGATPPVVTKGVLMGLYALDGWEADRGHPMLSDPQLAIDNPRWVAAAEQQTLALLDQTSGSSVPQARSLASLTA